MRREKMTASATAAVTKPVKKDSVPEIIAASMVGTAIEFYDNYCYSIAAASYFGMIFFTDVAKSNQTLATLMAFVTFAVSFLARPFGSMLFGHFGDKLGRKKTLVIALMTMGIATFLVGCLPGYEQIGVWSVVILCICRACQGVGLAGEWSGAALVATENAPADKRPVRFLPEPWRPDWLLLRLRPEPAARIQPEQGTDDCLRLAYPVPVFRRAGDHRPVRACPHV